MKNKAIRAVLAAACVTTAFGTTTVCGAENTSPVNEVSVQAQEETQEPETSEL